MADTPNTSSSVHSAPQTPVLSRLWPRLWPHLRAAFVAFHLLAISLDASPSPGAGMNRSAWSDPTVQGEFTRWARFLGTDRKTLEDALWAFAQQFVKARGAVMTPFNPWLEHTGTSQSWQMFVAPHRFPTRMQLQILPAANPADPAADLRIRDADWQTVYEERSPDDTWQAARFDTERLRASIFRWGWPNYQSAWKNACRVFARDLVREARDAGSPAPVAVRCRMFKQESPSPEAIRDDKIPAGKWVFVQVVKTDSLDAPPAPPAAPKTIP